MQDLPVYETRRRHLQNLIDGRFGAAQRKLAEAIDRSAVTPKHPNAH